MSCRAKDMCALQNMHIVQSGIFLKNSKIIERYRRSPTLDVSLAINSFIVQLQHNQNHSSLPITPSSPSNCILDTHPQNTPTASVFRDGPQSQLKLMPPSSLLSHIQPVAQCLTPGDGFWRLLLSQFPRKEPDPGAVPFLG